MYDYYLFFFTLNDIGASLPNNFSHRSLHLAAASRFIVHEINMRALHFLISLRQNCDGVHSPCWHSSTELLSSKHWPFKFQYYLALLSKRFWSEGLRKIIWQTNTVFAALEVHHNPARPVHQTSSDIQVLCQHDLHRNQDHQSSSSSSQWRVSDQECVMQTQRRAHTKYLSSHFELDDSANGAVSVYRADQSGITVQGLEHACRPWKPHEAAG